MAGGRRPISGTQFQSESRYENAVDARRALVTALDVPERLRAGPRLLADFAPRVIGAGDVPLQCARAIDRWDELGIALRRAVRDPALAGVVVGAPLGRLAAFLEALRDVHSEVPCLVVNADVPRDLLWTFGVEAVGDETSLDCRLVPFEQSARARATRIRSQAAAWAERWVLAPREAELLLRLAMGVRHRKLPETMGVVRATVVTFENRILEKSRLRRIEDAVALVTCGARDA